MARRDRVVAFEEGYVGELISFEQFGVNGVLADCRETRVLRSAAEFPKLAGKRKLEYVPARGAVGRTLLRCSSFCVLIPPLPHHPTAHDR